MPPKKKASEVVGPSASIPPPEEQTGSGVDAGGGTGADGGTHIVTRSKDKAPQTSASVHAPRPSQEARDRQRHGAPSTVLALEQGQAGGSRDAQGQHARQHAGTGAVRSPVRDFAPSNTVRSLSMSRTSRHSPPPPKTPEEALARAQLLLDYPPAPDKIDDRRATIQSLIGFANGDKPWQPSTSKPRQDAQAQADADKTAGGATTVHSPPKGQDRRLVGPSSTPTPPRCRTRELAAINAKFSKNDDTKTLALASSAEEKRGVSQTSALGPLLICMRQGNQATCRTR